MEQAVAFMGGSAITFYFAFKQLNSKSTQPGVLPIGTYNLPSSPLMNEIFTPSKGPNFTFPEDYTPALKAAHQDLITASRFGMRHSVLDPLRYLGNNNMGEPADTPWPQANLWTKGYTDPTDINLQIKV